MDILKAIQKADKTGCKCIRRTMGLMKSRTLQLESPHGILMTEIYNPASGMSPVTPHYALDLDDLDALTWDIATGIELVYAGPEPGRKAGNEDRIAAAVDALADEISNMLPTGNTDEATQIGALASAAAQLADARYSIARSRQVDADTLAIGIGKEPEHETQQEDGR